MAGAFVLLINDLHSTEIRLRAHEYPSNRGPEFFLTADQRRAADKALCNVDECDCEKAFGGASRILIEKTGERLEPYPLASNRGPAIGLRKKAA